MKIIRNITICGLAVLSMTGCKSLYGKYERPDVNTQGLFRDPVSTTDTLAANDTTTLGSLPWREVFTDPQLQALIQKAIDNNPNMLNAALNVDMAEAQLKAAKLAFLPSFAFTPQGTITRFNDATTRSYQLPVNASWNVSLFGGLTAAKRSSQMALLQTQDYKRSVQTSLVASVANLYYTLLSLDKQMLLVDDMEQLTKETWETLQKRFDTTAGTRSVSVQSAESNYYSVLTQKADLKRSIRECENSLSLLIGEPAHAIARGELDNQVLPSNLATGVGIQLLANRPDVHANEMALAQCFYNVEQARSNFYPNITISGVGGFSNGSGLVNPGKWLASAVGSLTQPIFQNGKLVAALRVAKDQYQQAYNTWQNSILTAGSEVSNALVQYNASEEKSQLESKQIELLKKNVEQTTSLMESMGYTYLDIITAQSNLLNAELSKVSDDLAKMQAVVSLYEALGGGSY